MRGWQRRLLYCGCAVAVITLGLASRRYGKDMPVFFAEYAGDTLWALMVFLGISAVAPFARVFQRGGIAFAFSYAIEVSQLYHAPWIDALGRAALGRFVLGFGFLWTDLVYYATGVAIGVMVDYVVYSKAGGDSRNGSTEAV